MTKNAIIHIGEKTDFYINGVGKTEKLHAKKSNWATFSPMEFNLRCEMRKLQSCKTA